MLLRLLVQSCWYALSILPGFRSRRNSGLAKARSVTNQNHSDWSPRELIHRKRNIKARAVIRAIIRAFNASKNDDVARGRNKALPFPCMATRSCDGLGKIDGAVATDGVGMIDDAAGIKGLSLIFYK